MATPFEEQQIRLDVKFCEQCLRDRISRYPKYDEGVVYSHPMTNFHWCDYYFHQLSALIDDLNKPLGHSGYYYCGLWIGDSFVVTKHWRVDVSHLRSIDDKNANKRC